MAKKSEAKPLTSPTGEGGRRPGEGNLPRPSDGRGIKGEGRPSSLLDTRVIYCGDNLDQIKKLPDACVDLIYIDPPFNSNRNYEIFWPDGLRSWSALRNQFFILWSAWQVSWDVR